MSQTDSTDSKLAHNVFFSLKDGSDVAVQRLIDDCFSYLREHAGVLFFSAGRLVGEHQRDVNDRDFEVGLHIIFTNKKAHDDYQTASKHEEFIGRNRENWAKVRVFDTYVL